MKAIGILGSTGSIGTQSLDVISWFPEDFQVDYLVANRNAELLAEQTKKFLPRAKAIADESKFLELKHLLPD